LFGKSNNYLYICSGFIAHYNFYGFIDYYNDTIDLARDILENEGWNSNHYNIMENNKDYEYYKSKGKVYKELVKIAKDILYPLFTRN
jgi:hypothetical protein